MDGVPFMQDDPAGQSIAIPPKQNSPTGHMLQLTAPASEYEVPVQLEQVLASGPENNPAAH